MGYRRESVNVIKEVSVYSCDFPECKENRQPNKGEHRPTGWKISYLVEEGPLNTREEEIICLCPNHVTARVSLKVEP